MGEEAPAQQRCPRLLLLPEIAGFLLSVVFFFQKNFWQLGFITSATTPITVTHESFTTSHLHSNKEFSGGGVWKIERWSKTWGTLGINDKKMHRWKMQGTVGVLCCAKHCRTPAPGTEDPLHGWWAVMWDWHRTEQEKPPSGPNLATTHHHPRFGDKLSRAKGAAKPSIHFREPSQQGGQEVLLRSQKFYFFGKLVFRGDDAIRMFSSYFASSKFLQTCNLCIICVFFVWSKFWKHDYFWIFKLCPSDFWKNLGSCTKQLLFNKNPQTTRNCIRHFLLD